MREFTDVLRDIQKGQFAEELTEAMGEIIVACQDTGKNGELTVKLKFNPGKTHTPVMTISADYNAKPPSFGRPDQFFFVAGKTLHVQNPDQGKLDLREVRKEIGPLNERLDEEAGEIIAVNQE